VATVRPRRFEAGPAALAGLALAAVLVLAGCGGGAAAPGEPAAGETEASAASETDTPATTASEAAPPTQPATTAEATTATSTDEEGVGETPEESAWLDESGVSELLAVYFPPDNDVEGKLGSTIDVELTADYLGLRVTSGGVDFVVSTDAESCRQKLEAAREPPTARLAKLARIARRACVQLERALLLLSAAYDEGSLVREPDYEAALAAMQRGTRDADRARDALLDLARAAS
jgi:hypothetical protein